MREDTFIVNQEWIGPVFYYEELNNCIEKLWDEVFCLFTNFEMIRNKHHFYISIQWGELKKVISHELKYNIPLYEYSKLDEKTRKEYYEQVDLDNRVSLICKVKTTSKDLNTKMVFYYLELFFYELFLVMNLSGPGCCNFASTSISDTSGNMFTHNFELSSHYFAHSWDIYDENKWPKIQYIPLITTWNWYESLNIDTKQLADTSTERALFALMTIAKNSLFDATTVIWLSHALEALYGNPKINIKQLLTERIIIVLKPGKIKIESKIKSFYRYRSKFVHGELGAKNPINNSLFDRNNKLDNYNCKLNSETYFSIAIVFSTIQQLILNNWREIRFMA